MTLSQIAIQRPVFAWMILFSLILFGTLGLRRLGINENPDVDFPNVRINYQYDGASPDAVEKDILEVVEGVLITTQGLRNIYSSASRGNANIDLEFGLDTDVNFALQEVQTLIGRVQRQLPKTVEVPTVSKANTQDDPIVILTLTAEHLQRREMMLLFNERIRDQFTTVDGVAEVRPYGYHAPQMRIDLQAKNLAKYELTASDVLTSINKNHVELPAGKLETVEQEEMIRYRGEMETQSEFSQLNISRRGGAPNYLPLPLEKVAKVYPGTETERRRSRVNGVAALGIAFLKRPQANAVQCADGILQQMEKVNEQLPAGTQLSLNYNRTTFIRDSVNELLRTLMFSALFTSLVCWLFLKSFSATVNILLAIPTTVIGTFAFMHLLGFSLNNFSLLGLSLAIGIVVDDVIVMLENIVRHQEGGQQRVQAALAGSKEITFAVIATTLVLVAIFIPIVMLPGIEGKFFLEFAVTLCIAVSLSSIEALTLTPMRCSQFLSLDQGLLIHRVWEKFLTRAKNFYLRSLAWVLLRPKKMLTVGVLFFVVSLLCARWLPREFAPALDRGAMFLVFIAPDGKSMEYTDKKIKEFETIVSNHPAVERIFVAVGGHGKGGQGNRGNGMIRLKDYRLRSPVAVVAKELREQAKSIEGLQVIIRDNFGSVIGGHRGSPIEFTIHGPDFERQREIFRQLREQMEASGKMVGVRSDDVAILPEVHLVPRRQWAMKREVEVAEVAALLNIAVGGTVAGQYNEKSRRFDLFLQMQESDRQSVEQILQLPVRNNRGELVDMGELVDVKRISGPQIIVRENRGRVVRVDGNLENGADYSAAVSDIQKFASSLTDDQYYLSFSQSLDESLLQMLLVILLGIVISYMVLASQFNSFLDPLLVFLAIPFGISGGLIILAVTGNSINVYTMIGLLLTLGLVMKNSILLVEFTHQMRERGMEVVPAIMTACPLRFRPIIMTTFATLAAAIPVALSFGPGSETRVPMALVVLGGVSISTFFTLYLVPCAYQLWAQPRKNWAQLLAKRACSME